MFSAFWDDAYVRVFDGGSVLVPAVYPHVDMTVLPVLGTILSHGFLSSGFLPIRLAFPVVYIVCSTSGIPVSDTLIMVDASCIV